MPGAVRCLCRATGAVALVPRDGGQQRMPFYPTSRSKQDLPDLPGTDTPTSPHPEETRRALAYLHDRGTHFVLLADKKPLWKGYLKRRPALETVLHSPELGVVPWSLQNTALDVDRGEPVQLCLFHPPLVILASGQADHCHLYYRDTEPRRNGNWDAFGCGGQKRGANGFLRLWHPQSSVQLLFALVHNPHPCLFPADLFQAPAAKRYRPPADPGEPYTRRLPLPSIDLGQVEVGNRNNSLFDVVRFWSYAEAKPQNMHVWHEQVRVYAQSRNLEFRRPLPVDEVNKLALSVSTWVWSGGGPTHHRTWTPEQRRRGGITWGRMRRHDNLERDRAIVRAVKVGRSMRQVARDFGLSDYAVRHIVKRARAIG